MGRASLLLLALGFVPCAPLRAAPAPERYVTEFGRRVLVLCDMVGTAEVSGVNPPFRGISTARVTVADHLFGLEQRPVFTLMYIEDFLAPDAIRATFESGTVAYQPKRSERAGRILQETENVTGNKPREASGKEVASDVPGAEDEGSGVRLIKGEKGLFFLRRKGASFALIGFIPERDPLFARKRKRLDDLLAIEAVASPDARLRAAKAYFLRGLGSDDLWERGNAAREIESLARRHADMFKPDERNFIAERLYLEENPNIAAALERAVRGVAPDEARAYAFEAEQRERARFAEALAREEKLITRNRLPEMRAADLVRLAQRYGRAATVTLCDYLADTASIVRESVAGVLSRHGGPSCREPLRKALAREQDPDAARAMIHTLGVKSDPEAVPLIAPWLKNRETERTAIHALARIGTDDAWATIVAHREGATASGRSLIESLLQDRAKAR